MRVILRLLCNAVLIHGRSDKKTCELDTSSISFSMCELFHHCEGLKNWWTEEDMKSLLKIYLREFKGANTNYFLHS